MKTKEEKAAYQKLYRESHVAERKEYQKKYSKVYFQANKEKLKEPRAKRREENIERYREYGRKCYDLNKEKNLLYQEQYRKENRKIIKAHSAILLGLRNGSIIKPSSCTICGKGDKIESHHHDYDKPLDVIWVCTKCHKKIHL